MESYVCPINEEPIQLHIYSHKKGSSVHIAPTCARSEEGSDHFRSYVCSLSLHFCKRLFLGLEPMMSWSQGNSFTAAPGLPFYSHIYSQTVTKKTSIGRVATFAIHNIRLEVLQSSFRSCSHSSKYTRRALLEKKEANISP
jgi:hypothetical protein